MLVQQGKPRGAWERRRIAASRPGRGERRLLEARVAACDSAIALLEQIAREALQTGNRTKSERVELAILDQKRRRTALGR